MSGMEDEVDVPPCDAEVQSMHACSVALPSAGQGAGAAAECILVSRVCMCVCVGMEKGVVVSVCVGMEKGVVVSVCVGMKKGVVVSVCVGMKKGVVVSVCVGMEMGVVVSVCVGMEMGVVMSVSCLSCSRRIRGQFDRLSRELNEVAAVAINKKKPLRVRHSHQITERQWTTPFFLSPQHSRSLPAIGIKPMAKKRPSLFNIVDHAAVDEFGEPLPEEDGYQLCADATHVPGLAVAKGIEVREKVE